MTKVWASALLFSLGCAAACGQTRAKSAPALSIAPSANGGSISAAESAALAEVASRAAVIFAGHVLTIARQDETGFVDVTFRVDAPVRGVSRLGTYTVREWAGFWVGSPARYRVGQRYLMLLTARGPSGYSGPVGGSEGVIPITAVAASPIADARGIAPAEDGSDGADLNQMRVDLRWLDAVAVRATLAPSIAHVEPIANSDGWGGPIAPLLTAATPRSVPSPSAVSGGGTVALSATVGTVLTLLRGATWPGAQ